MYLKLETVARGLGFTTVATSGNEVVRWGRVEGYLRELGVPTSGHNDLGVTTSCNGTNYREMCPEFISENIFYRLAMKAKNEVAEKFQAKVADEIIPSIRRTGGYQVHMPQGKELLALAVLEAQRTIEAQATEIDRMKPKEIFADAVSTSHTAILIGDLAKILKQNGIETGQKRLFAWLRENGFLIKRKGTDWNMPTQKSMEMGLFEVKESTVNNPDGSVRINRTTKVTGKGQVYFVNKFLEVMA